MLGALARAFERGLAAQGVTYRTSVWREALTSFSQTVSRGQDEVDLITASEIHDVVYACVRVVARTAAQVPLVVARGNEEQPSHPLAELLERPNPEHTRQLLIEGILWQLMLDGNAYVEVVYDRGLEPVELWPITESVEVIPGDDGLVDGYRVKVKGTDIDLGREEVLHFKLFHPRDAWYGLSPIQAYREGIITDLKAFQYNKALLDNNAVPGGIISVQQPLTQNQMDEMARNWERYHKGPERAGRVAILHRGGQFQEIGLSPKDIGYVQQRGLSVDSLRRIYGVPGVMLGRDDEVTFAAASISQQVFMHTTIMPILRMVEAVFNNRLVPLIDPEVSLRFDVSRVELLVETMDLKSNIGLKLLRQGWTPNQIRDVLWNLPPVEDEAYDQAYIEANLIPLGMVNKSVLGQVPQEMNADALERMMNGQMGTEIGADNAASD